MGIDFGAFGTQLNDAIVMENGPQLAYLLRPTSAHSKDLVRSYKNPTRQILTHHHGGSMQSPWDDVAISYILVCSNIAKKRYIDAFKEEAQLISSFYRFFTENRGWTLPALFSILRDLRDLAFDADLQAKYSNQKAECMEEAARVISKAFTHCMTDRTSPPDQTRKWGVYYIVGLILKSYFRIKRIALAKNILRALDASNDLPPLSSFPRAHQVTYRYYIGMLRFLEEDFPKAEQELTLAFYNCYREARNNQERILAYLIPLRILRGHLPSTELLGRFPTLRTLFLPFVNAIQVGDIYAYDSALEEKESKLVDLNLWLILEKAREHCLRSLFRKVWVFTGKSTRIPIATFHAALKVSGIDVPMEEAECLLANQIFKGFMRGYISHERQTVVLANANTFPRLADRPTPLAIF